MHGIKEIINFNDRNQEAQRIIAQTPKNQIDKDYLVRQQALDAYLKAKYGNK